MEIYMKTGIQVLALFIAILMVFTLGAFSGLAESSPTLRLAKHNLHESSWTVYGDARLPDESRMLNAAVNFLWTNLDWAPKHLNVGFEIAPTDGVLQRILTPGVYELYKAQPPVYALANHYDVGSDVVTLKTAALDFDWRARSILVHELEHIRLNSVGIKSSTKCGRLAHEIRATRAEANHYQLTGVPSTGEGLTFRQGNATLLKRYNTEYFTNHCHGR